MKLFKLIQGDCLKQIKQLKDNSIDSIVTDPPYGLKFMSKRWDYDVPSKELWQEALRVLKPGGHLLAFGGTRTYHRLVLNIEDAGFDIRDCISWLYGSGFPKSYNIAKGIEKYLTEGNASKELETAEAKQWDGWGTALKPSQELVCLARKPIEGNNVKNVQKWGVGGLNIDGSRIETTESTVRPAGGPKTAKSMFGLNSGQMTGSTNGRYPANTIFECLCDETYVGGETTHTNPNCPCYVLDQQSGKLPGPSRFFYSAKVSSKEKQAGLNSKNTHPTVKPIKLMEYLIKLITPPGGLVLDPYMGSGTTGIAAVTNGFYFIGIEREEEYLEIAQNRMNHWIK